MAKKAHANTHKAMNQYKYKLKAPPHHLAPSRLLCIKNNQEKKSEEKVGGIGTLYAADKKAKWCSNTMEGSMVAP